MHDLRLGPEINQRHGAALQTFAGFDPDFAMYDETRPGPMPRHWLAGETEKGIVAPRVSHLRRPATFWNQATMAAGM